MEPWRLPIRRTERLHKGRASIPGAWYFVTIVAKNRRSWLGFSGARQAAIGVLNQWHSEADGRMIAANVMPDHVHALFELGGCLTVGQTIARWKTGIRRRIRYAEDFQRDFWEHQLRSTENMEDYALYIFLNPYRANLLPAGNAWPGWWAPQPGLFRFMAFLDSNGAPPREWTGWPDAHFSGLEHGE